MSSLKKPFLMLCQATTIDDAPTGWFVSEKLDGIRAIWIPWTRGVPVADVPWCDESGDLIATGLWSRQGKVIRAPNWWLDGLSNDIMDGELMIRRSVPVESRFAATVSQVRSHNGDWTDVRLHVFDTPLPGDVFCGRTLPWGKRIDESMCPVKCVGVRRFNGQYDCEGEMVVFVAQKHVTDLAHYFSWVVGEDGEGIVLRRPGSVWVPKRTPNTLKVKRWDDMEGVVVGWTEGKGRLEGMVGALTVEVGKVRFDLSGMCDADREIGAVPIGTVVTFRYERLSEDGVPLKARFLRRRGD